MFMGYRVKADGFGATNDHVDRAPANTVSKVRSGPSGASVQHFVIASVLKNGKYREVPSQHFRPRRAYVSGEFNTLAASVRK